MKYLREISVAVAYGACCRAAFERPDFYPNGQFWKTLVYSAPISVAAIGMTLVIIAREIDISIGWQLSVCAIVAAVLSQQRDSLPIVIAAAVITGAVGVPIHRETIHVQAYCTFSPPPPLARWP